MAMDKPHICFLLERLISKDWTSLIQANSFDRSQLIAYLTLVTEGAAQFQLEYGIMANLPNEDFVFGAPIQPADANNPRDMAPWKALLERHDTAAYKVEMVSQKVVSNASGLLAQALKDLKEGPPMEKSDAFKQMTLFKLLVNFRCLEYRMIVVRNSVAEFAGDYCMKLLRKDPVHELTAEHLESWQHTIQQDKALLDAASSLDREQLQTLKETLPEAIQQKMLKDLLIPLSELGGVPVLPTMAAPAVPTMAAPAAVLDTEMHFPAYDKFGQPEHQPEGNPDGDDDEADAWKQLQAVSEENLALRRTLDLTTNGLMGLKDRVASLERRADHASDPDYSEPPYGNPAGFLLRGAFDLARGVEMSNQARYNARSGDNGDGSEHGNAGGVKRFPGGNKGKGRGGGGSWQNKGQYQHDRGQSHGGHGGHSGGGGSRPPADNRPSGSGSGSGFKKQRPNHGPPRFGPKGGSGQ